MKANRVQKADGNVFVILTEGRQNGQLDKIYWVNYTAVKQASVLDLNQQPKLVSGKKAQCTERYTQSLSVVSKIKEKCTFQCIRRLKQKNNVS